MQDNKNKATLAALEAKKAKADIAAAKAKQKAEDKAAKELEKEKERLKRARRGPRPQMRGVAEAADSASDLFMCAAPPSSAHTAPPLRPSCVAAVPTRSLRCRGRARRC